MKKACAELVLVMRAIFSIIQFSYKRDSNVMERILKPLIGVSKDQEK